jgi:hypothetical protein
MTKQMHRPRGFIEKKDQLLTNSLDGHWGPKYDKGTVSYIVYYTTIIPKHWFFDERKSEEKVFPTF